MTERQCPLCHIHAIQSPHGQCANANCPPFEEWPVDLASLPAWTPRVNVHLDTIIAPIVGEAEPSPAPLVEVETVDGSRDSPRLDDRGGGGHVADLVPPQGADLAPGEASPSLKLLPKVELMPAPQPIRTLGETLGNILKAATERADKLAQRVQTSSDELHKVMDATEEVSQDMDRVTADMKTKLGLGGNGGPAL